MTALRESMLRKQAESARAQRALLEAEADRLEECARALAAVFDRRGSLFVMGSGGSACDAQHLAVECMHPIVEKRPALPAIALCADAAMLSAVANDRDFSLAFTEQLEVLARDGDAALAISTSGSSRGVVRAMEHAKRRRLLTIGFAGKDGGKLPELCDFAFVVPSYSTHRIQEAHGLLLHLLWDAVHVARGEEDVLG